jgi:hypothetical protein
MSFREQRLPDLVKRFKLSKHERFGLFSGVPPVQPSDGLLETLRYNAPLAADIGTEKARSELIVAPILVELKRRHRPEISLFSGVEFSVAPEEGLSGVCDFLLSRSPDQLFVTAPVVTLVEAKNENIREGLGQCLAEMLAAQRFNEREGNAIPTLFGSVTTGTTWKFLSLTEKLVTLDLDEYLITQPEKILGVLVAMVTDTASK